MPYDIRMLGHYPKLTSAQVRIIYEPTFTMLARRTGILPKPGDNPEKVADEPLAEPLKTVLHVPREAQEEAYRAARSAKFSPEWIANLRELTFDESRAALHIKANSINYGSLPAIRTLNKKFPMEVMNPIMRQASPIGVIGALLSEKNQAVYNGRRSGSVLVGEKWMTMPAGGVHEGDNLFDTLRTEAKEENGMALAAEGSAFMIGAALSVYHAGDTNFNFVIYTDWTLQKVKENMNPEHDDVVAVQLDEREMKRYLADSLVGERLVDAGLASLLQVGRLQFGVSWYNEAVEELRPLARIAEENMFAGAVE